MSFFFFNDTATTEIYTLSLHDALPILRAADREVGCNLSILLRVDTEFFHSRKESRAVHSQARGSTVGAAHAPLARDRKSTRLNSSHSQISYAVFCLKKKKTRRLTSHTI